MRQMSRRGGLIAAVWLLGGVAGLELLARFGLGLGTPILYVRDAEIEYLAAPGQDIRRFRNRVIINRFSQRSPDVDPIKTQPNELRVLLLGDSIVFGGAQFDQARTVGALVEHDLARSLRSPVRVLTAAADSWGPANVAAYLRRFGTFDADVAVWVFPTGDWFDAPGDGSVVGRDPSFPDRNPWLPSTELLGHYVWGRFVVPAMFPVPRTERRDAGQRVLQNAAMVRAVTQLRHARVQVLLVHWPTLAGLTGDFDRVAMASFFAHARNAGACLIDFTPNLTAFSRVHHPVYRDTVHPTEATARWLAEQLVRAVLSHRTGTGL
jgi:hypothetical protein